MRVARSRAHQQFIATRPAESLARMIAGSSDEGTGMTRTLEGDTVFTAYTRLQRVHWTVAMGLPASAVYLGVFRTTAAYVIAVAFSLIVGLLAAFALARRINRPMAELREAAHSLGRGEEAPIPDTGIREIHDVGAAIADAARKRRAFEAEREDLLRREQAARSEAEAASRAKDNFLAMLGHELRNPLAALSNAASLLKHGGNRPDIAARSRDVIERQVTHLARLTDDILDAARALLGKIELRPEPVDLAKVAAQALATLGATGRTDRHQLKVQLEEAWIEGDPVRLDQIVSNLLVNAVKYTPERGTITVRTRRTADESVLTVADDGVGMSPDLAARAFDLFVQGERGLDRAQGGLGIGLTLVRRLAELHHGSAEVVSEGDNRGSEFTVRFPAIAKPAAPPAPSGPLARGTPRTILVVEDNTDARETLQILLSMMGHHVESAVDGVTGLEKALSMAPDVALVDLGLPGMDGYELARRLRASGGRSVYLVAVTGYGAQEDMERAIAAGFDAHVTKPLSAEELAEMLRNVRTSDKATSAQ
jgi:signal transduction histidine kinase/ActR/RegA family two-component response regulator